MPSIEDSIKVIQPNLKYLTDIQKEELGNILEIV